MFHLANGLWTMGITWGAWTSPGAQQKALYACGVFGVGLLAVGMSALGGMVASGSGEGFEQARRVEEQMFEAKVESGLVSAGSHKWVGNHPVGDDGARTPRLRKRKRTSKSKKSRRSGPPRPPVITK